MIRDARNSDCNLLKPQANCNLLGPQAGPNLLEPQAGLTLVELMVSLVVSSILLALILGVQVRMSAAYRTQSKISKVSDTLRASVGLVAEEVRMAGYMIPEGFEWAGGAQKALAIVNDADQTGPDRIAIHFANAEHTARVLAFSPNNQSVQVSSVDGFLVGETVVLVNPTLTEGENHIQTVSYAACMVQLTFVDSSDNTLDFAASPPYNTATNSHCNLVAMETASESMVGSETMIYRLESRHYAISPDNKALGILLMSTSTIPSADFTDSNEWQPLAYGVINLQFATRYFEKDDSVDVDQDGDPTRDWYSGDAQNGETERPAGIAEKLSVSVETRSEQPIASVTAVSSPAIIDEDLPNYNSLGDWAGVDLLQNDSERPESYRGKHVFRMMRSVLDLRNLGVGI